MQALTEAIPSASGASATRDNGMDDYRRLQRRLLVATALASALAVPLTALVFDPAVAASLLVGSLAGVLYLFLLARSVSRLGVDSKSVGKVQLLVPIVLVLAAARIPQLQMLPALVGFLLYKPALIVQAVIDG
jgi:ATP synthase protein I